MNKGTIKFGNNTKGHFAALSQLGYKVERDAEGNIVTEVEGFVTALDLSEGSPEPLMDVIGAQKALTYGTKLTLRDPESGETKTFSGVPMCLKLGAISKRMGLPVNLSCLVMKAEGGGKKAAAVAVPANWAAFSQLLAGVAPKPVAAPMEFSTEEETEGMEGIRAEMDEAASDI